MRRRVWLLGALALLLTAAGAGYLTRELARTRSASLPALPVSTVPATWHDVREAPGHRIHVGDKGIACRECHGEKAVFEAPSLRVCDRCHQGQATIQHALSSPLGALEGSDCTSCHAFRGATPATAWSCMTCHELPQGRHRAIEVHADQACGECHQPHEAHSIAPKACVTCHAEAGNSHAHLSSQTADNCLTCHDAHAPASVAAQRCEGCHDKPHALFAGGHEQCTSCHTPHGFAREEVRACRSCHSEQHALAEQKVPEHRVCTSCHDPHAAKPAAETCQSCHNALAPQHPSVDGHTCIGCHAPHDPRSPGAVVQACTSCHSQAHDDGSAHGAHAQCTQCHAPHAFAHPAQAQACSTCHALQLTATAQNSGHARCLGCHRGDIHGGTTELAPIACGECHTAVHPRPEHAQCTSCHEPHAGAPRSVAESCGTCHAREQASVQHGQPGHQVCTDCHEPHTGSKPPSARCLECHADKAKANHVQPPHIADTAATPAAPSCSSCHSVHGSSGPLATPTCTSCHAPAQLPGAHAVPAHQNCLACHQSGHNAGPWSERKLCISCHREQQNHQPEAALCQGCHVFRH